MTLCLIILDKIIFLQCQSGFIPGDSYVAQLLSITHEIYQSSDFSPTRDIKGVFLDNSNAFDKLWHKGLLFKLKPYGKEGSLLRLLKSYSTARQQRVALNEQTSSWLNVTEGVSQGSVLGPLLFLIYMNDLPDGTSSSCKIFADYTSLFSKIENKSYYNFQLNKNLETTSKWAFQWKMLFNPDPIKQAIEVCFSHKRDKAVYPPLKFNNN